MNDYDYSTEQKREAFAAADRYFKHMEAGLLALEALKGEARKRNPLFGIFYADGYLEGKATAEAEVKRLRWMLARTGGLERLAQCPSCLAERTNGERHADDCPLVAQIEGTE